MKKIFYSSQFKKDIKLAQKRHKDIEKFKAVAALLVAGDALDDRYKDHALKGNLSDYRECHLEPDWLLVYRTNISEIHFSRIGTHSDIFG